MYSTNNTEHTDHTDHTDQHENINVCEMKPMISPWVIKEELKITNQMRNDIISSRKIISDILKGSDNRFLVISGPCSIHDYDSAIEYAHRLKELSIKYPKLYIVMRVYFEKPRTNIGWKGLINDPDLNNTFNINKGIRMARELLMNICEIGLPIGCEFLDTIVPQYISDLVSWGAIGARTVESQVHRELVSGLSMPVGFKNGTSGNIRVAVDSIISAENKHCFLGITDEGTPAIITTKGNQNTHIILRGGSNGPNYSSEYINSTIDIMSKDNLDTNIVVDCSHGNSQKIYQNQLCVAKDIVEQISKGQTRIKGIMLESHLVEGNQKLGEDKDKLVYGKSITDACINLETTEIIFNELSF